MDTKKCSMCIIEKQINNYYKRYTERKDCNRTRGSNHYHENKDKISNQQKKYYEKNRDKILLQKQNSRCIQIKDLIRSYVELENRLKTLEEKNNTQQMGN